MTIVYILISNVQDLYYEQLLVSLYSLRLYNPQLNVVVLVDDVTERTLHGTRSKVRELANEIKVVPVPEEYNPKERSRYIKTTFRNFLTGNLLFIDTDTVITDSIKEVENTNYDIACALDYHSTLSQRFDGAIVRKQVLSTFKEDISEENVYFNSGVIWLRDTLSVRELFGQWNHYWKKAAFEAGKCFDQPALVIANRKCGHIIKELDGIYNCQILASMRYLHKAKIIHFFNNVWQGKEQLSPFLGRELYEEIKKTGEISNNTKRLLIECKSSFCAPTYFVCKEQVEFLNDIVGITLYSSFLKHNFIYGILKFICRLRYILSNHIMRR